MEPRRAILADSLLAFLLYAMAMAELQYLLDLDLATLEWPVHGATAAVILPLTVRRQMPLTVMVIVVGGLAAQALYTQNSVAEAVAGIIAVYSVGRYGRPVRRDLVRGGGMIALVGVFVANQDAQDLPAGGARFLPLLSVLALYAGAWLLGEQSRRGHERQQQLESTTAQLRAERARTAEQAATEERLRLARELHDVLGHHVSVMGVQAAGARRNLPPETDERVEGALAAIERSARDAVNEMQRVLRLLRRSRLEDGAYLDDLDGLVDEVRNAGIHVSLQVEGDPGQLDPSIDLVASRVVQESLTNVLRHAGPGTAACVGLQIDDEALVLWIEDDGRGTPARTSVTGSGTGLRGMRERVERRGGEFEAGPVPDGGFLVRASLPTEAATPGGLADRS